MVCDASLHPGRRLPSPGVGTCAIVSFRLGMADGVSIVAGSWRRMLERLGWRTYTVAGAGPVDRLLPGLDIDAPRPPTGAELDAALADADLVLVENLLSIPLNLAAARVLARTLAGRPAVLHHHDPPWQRERFAHITELPPDDPAWRHVTINRLTEAEFAQRGIEATTIYNGVRVDVPPGDRDRTRERFGVEPDRRLFVHPVRAIERKGVPTALALAERFDAVYWLTGPAEEGYQPVLDRLMAGARCPVIHRSLEDGGLTAADLYAASDLVLFPSTWEGFGVPPIEAAVHRRPVVVGRYPVANELMELGFDWLDPDLPEEIESVLKVEPTEMLDRNHKVVSDHLSLEAMTRSLAALLETFPDRAGW